MKNAFLILGSFILATILGFYAQSIGIFIEGITSIFDPFTYLAIITVSSYFFYILAFFLMFYGKRKGMILPKNPFIAFLYVLFSFISIIVCMFSFFVLAMSGG